jgi:anti-sigma regulatory factor (Ser/Thr protein kinase)
MGGGLHPADSGQYQCRMPLGGAAREGCLVCVSRRFEFDSGSDAPSFARRFARTELCALLAPAPEVSETVGDVELMVSELVSNAVKASTAPVTLGLEVHHKWLGVTVHDDGPEEPVMRNPDPSEAHGRGLRIIAVLAETWGVRPDPAGGKAVWLRVPLPVAATDHLECDHPDDLEWTG